jgi:hypothetical protein
VSLPAPLDLEAWFKQTFAPLVDAPAPLESVAGTWDEVDDHLTQQQGRISDKLRDEYASGLDRVGPEWDDEENEE